MAMNRCTQPGSPTGKPVSYTEWLSLLDKPSVKKHKERLPCLILGVRKVFQRKWHLSGGQGEPEGWVKVGQTQEGKKGVLCGRMADSGAKVRREERAASVSWECREMGFKEKGWRKVGLEKKAGVSTKSLGSEVKNSPEFTFYEHSLPVDNRTPWKVSLMPTSTKHGASTEQEHNTYWLWIQCGDSYNQGVCKVQWKRGGGTV